MSNAAITKELKSLLKARTGLAYRACTTSAGGVKVDVPKDRLARSDRVGAWDTSEDAAIAAATGLPINKCFGSLYILPGLFDAVLANLRTGQVTPITEAQVLRAWKDHL